MPRVSGIPGAVAICLVVLCTVLAGCEGTPAPLQENGSVRILSLPAGAAVYLDGEYRGTTPATVTAVPAGNHTLEVRADGYERWTAPVTIEAGSMANVSATLDAIPATALPVTSAWWDAWSEAFGRAGGRADEWRFAAELPEDLREMDRLAGLDHAELTARSLWMGGEK